MTILIDAAMLAGTSVKINGSNLDFKPPEFNVHFNSKYTEHCFTGVIFRNIETAGINSDTDL